MTDKPKTTHVLVSTDDGATWTTHPAVPGGPAAAVKRVRDTNPDLLAAPNTLYAALGPVTIYKRQMVEQFEPVRADIGDAAIVHAAQDNAMAEGKTLKETGDV